MRSSKEEAVLYFGWLPAMDIMVWKRALGRISRRVMGGFNFQARRGLLGASRGEEKKEHTMVYRNEMKISGEGRQGEEGDKDSRQ